MRSQRQRKKSIQVNYVNVLSLTRSSGPMSYWDVIEDMRPYLKRLPLLEQIGGTCVLYSIQTAIQVATRENVEAPVCSTKIKKDGTLMEKHLRKLGIRSTGDPRYRSVDQYPNPNIAKRYNLLLDIVKALESGNVVVAGGGPELAQDTIYDNTVIPVFNNTRARNVEHNVCIIGCYQDKYFGPCFITKMTNKRSDAIPTKYRKEGFGPQHLSYGIIPISLLSTPSSNLYLTEFAILPVQRRLKF